MRIPPALVAVMLLAGCRTTQVDNSQHAPAIQKIMSSAPAWAERSRLGSRLWEAERNFYQSRSNLPAWIDGDAATPRLDALIDALRRSEEHGLDSSHYGLENFQSALAAARTNKGHFELTRVADLDARLTYAYLHYAADLLGWSANPKAIYDQWVVTPKNDDLAARLTRAVESNQVGQTIEELAPEHPQYKGLQAALAAERRNPTGHLDQLRINLERWRWMPRDLGDRYVLVNVPAYQMQVIEGGRPALAMRVIVGAPKTPTPLFSDEMTNVVFSPSWNIPEKIIRTEMVPHQVNDPSYLDRHEIEVVGTSGDAVDLASVDWNDERSLAGLRFRQAPGPENALGLVKFIFPNQFDVYLHDTPNDALFNKPSRAMSHGCVRLENPVALAQYVMRDKPQWTAEKISAAMNSQQEQAVPLKEHLPIHIAYFTAWVTPDGAVTYTDDPYKLDEKQARAGHFGPSNVPSVTSTSARTQ
jgi:murein L,D-transpeptidase YcbB/YkuD